MPSNAIKEVRKDVAILKESLGVIANEIKWLKWIICGAAGMGFLEKLLGWMVGK